MLECSSAESEVTCLRRRAALALDTMLLDAILLAHWLAARWLVAARIQHACDQSLEPGDPLGQSCSGGPVISYGRLGRAAVLSRAQRRHPHVHRHHRFPGQRQRRDQDRRGRAWRRPAAARSRFAKACWVAGRAGSTSTGSSPTVRSSARTISATSWRCRTSKRDRWRGSTPSGTSKTGPTISGPSASA